MDAKECDECGASLIEVEPEYCDMSGESDWEFWKEYLDEKFREKYPSLTAPMKDTWDNDETKIFLWNDFVEIGISEYMGLASISMRVSSSFDDDDWDGETRSRKNLAENFADNLGQWMSKNVGDLYKVGTFSNGESIYEGKGEQYAR